MPWGREVAWSDVPDAGAILSVAWKHSDEFQNAFLGLLASPLLQAFLSLRGPSISVLFLVSARPYS